MYSLLALSLVISLLARGDFVGLIIAIYVFVLFLFQGHLDSLDYLKTYLKINLGAIVYDTLWLVFHFSGYWSGNENEQAEIRLKRVTYIFSVLSFAVKVALEISVFIAYDKAINKAKKQQNIKTSNTNIQV